MLKDTNKPPEIAVQSARRVSTSVRATTEKRTIAKLRIATPGHSHGRAHSWSVVVGGERLSPL